MTTKVPCNGCTCCCFNQEVFLTPEDDQYLPYLAYEEFEAEGGIVRRLRSHLDGKTCIHLTKDGCGVYEHRPETCRTFDCRIQYLSLTVEERNDTDFDQIMWKEAEKRLPTVDQEDRQIAKALRRQGRGAGLNRFLDTIVRK